MSWHCATNSSNEANQAIEFADCTTFNFENTLPGDLTEAQRGYAQELAAIDMDILPETIDISGLSALRRAIVAYMLEIKLEDLGETLNTDVLDETYLLSKVLLGAFAKAQVANQNGFDFSFFRRGIHHYYSCARGFPLTLEGFYQHYGAFDTATSETVDSAPKAGPRRLSHLAHEGIFRAEALKDNVVRETEFIIVGHRADGALDFVTYDQNGDLVNQSEFASSTGQLNLAATPYACMTCHRDQTTQAFNIINPDDVD